MGSDVEEATGISNLKTGLTWRAVFAIMTAALLFIPTSIYLNLVSGSTVAAAAVYVIAILFSEVTRFFGSPLTKQELFIVYTSVGAVASAIPAYYWLIYRAFFVNTPVTYAYQINGRPLPELVPYWLAPNPSSPSYELRSLFHPDWALAISVASLTIVFGVMVEMGLAMYFSYLFVEVERLRYPFAIIDASLINTLSERESEKVKFFMSGFYPGLLYGVFLYASFALGFQIIPIPWADFTWLTEKYLPGAIIGVQTTPDALFFGFLLPLNVAGAICLGSVIVWIVLNSFFTVNRTFFPDWASEYYRGMSIQTIYQRSFQRIWISPQFGFILGIAIGLVAALSKSLVRSFRVMVRATRGTRAMEYPPPKLAVALFLGGSLGSVLLFELLVPEIPFYIPLATSLGLSFLVALLSARSVGELGFFPTLPWPWQAIVYFTSYQGYAGWVFSPYISLGATGSYAQAVKVAYLTETKPYDFFKGIAIATVLNSVVGLISLDFFWRIAPIPSSAYPQTMIFWPINATNDSLFATRQIKIDQYLLLGSAGISLAILASEIMMRKVGIPFSATSFIVGFMTLPTWAIMTLVGSLVGKIVLSKYIGKERWENLRGILVAGFVAGSGVFIGLGISVTLLARAAWIWPW